MKNTLIKVMLVAGLSSSVLMAHTGDNEIGLNINNDTVEVSGQYNFYKNFNVTASYININENNKDADMTTIGVNAVDSSVFPNTTVGMGLKSVISNAGDYDFFAVAPNLFAKYHVNDIISVGVDLSYAPEILTGLDANSYKEARVEADVRIIENGYIYTGYRYIETNYDISDAKLDESVYIGFKVKF